MYTCIYMLIARIVYLASAVLEKCHLYLLPSQYIVYGLCDVKVAIAHRARVGMHIYIYICMYECMSVWVWMFNI